MEFRGVRKFLALGGLLCLSSLEAWAISSTETLPKGVRALAFVYANAPDVNASFTPSGTVESLSRPLNRSVTMDDLESSEPRLKTLRKALNDLSPQLLGEQIVVSNLYSDVRVNEKRYVTGLMWGFSDTFMAGAIVPYIKRNVAATFEARTVNNAATLRTHLGPGMPEIADALEQIHNYQFDTSFYEQKIFRDNGYQPPRSYEVSGTGDVELEARWKYLQRSWGALGARMTVKTPTASHKADITNPLDRDFGERTWGAKVASVHTVQLVPYRLQLQSGLAGTWRAPVTQTLAVARSPEQTLPNLNDPEQVEAVKKELGSQIDADAGLNLELFRGAMSVFSSYQWTWKEADRYSGSRKLDYERLSKNTKIRGQTWEAGAELSSVGHFLRGKFPLPAKLVASYVQPISGKNSLYASYGRMDAILFF